MKIIVQYSGGKDSQATLIHAAKIYGAQNIEAVFCDTKWENPITYKHIKETTKQLGVKLTILTSKKINGMIGLVAKKGRFPSTKARFCTEELKVKPFIDYLLDQVKDNVLVYQGIRKDESDSRSKMNKICRLFKYYIEPYKVKNNKKIYHTYRKKEVLQFIKKYDDSVSRPFFNFTAQQVIDYIIENGQVPNPLYKKGFKRVGCFPCIMATQQEVKQIQRYFPTKLEEIIALEEKFSTSFFNPTYIPKRCCSKESIAKKGLKRGEIIKYPTTTDVVNYINGKNATIDLFDPDSQQSCMSVYQLCE